MRIVILSVLVFFIILGCGLSFAQSEEPEEESNPYFWDFGQVAQGEILEHTFVLENDSIDTLRIKDIHSSCGCTTSEIKRKKILPGESVDVSVSFDTKGYSGKVGQSVRIHTDQQERPTITLTLKADIQESSPAR